MSVITTEKYHIHSAQQFVESLSEGLRTYSTATASVGSGNTVVSISTNVFETIRKNDILVMDQQSRTITAVNNVVLPNGNEITQVTIDTPFSTGEEGIENQPFQTREPLRQYDTYYLFVGRPTPWRVSDRSPEIAEDTEQTGYDYLRDAMALRRITDRDVAYIVPKQVWANGSQYPMYDHRMTAEEFSNNEDFGYPYVLTSTNDVFKCIFNGRTSNDAPIPLSIQEPSITGVESPSNLVTTAGENGTYYVWKYLYTIPNSMVDKFVTLSYMPVITVADTLNPLTGDIQDDNSPEYRVFDNARKSANGAIYQIVVENGGSGYSASANNGILVEIDGDGEGAVADANITGDAVSSINIGVTGQHYSFATVSILGGGGSGARATAIISPRHTFSNTSGTYYYSNHGINPRQELHAHRVMLYAELAGSENNTISVANQYRRIGIIKNPILRTGKIAENTIYDLTTTLRVSSDGNQFVPDEIVYQKSTHAYGIVVEHVGDYLKLTHTSRVPFSSAVADTTIIGIGNGNSANIFARSEEFMLNAIPCELSAENEIPPSGTTARVEQVILPDIMPYTGEILYVNHRDPVNRLESQSEAIRTILTF